MKLDYYSKDVLKKSYITYEDGEYAYIFINGKGFVGVNLGNDGIKNTKDVINTQKRIKNEDKEKLSRTLQRKDSIKLSKIRKNSIYKKREEDKTDERIRRKSIFKWN